MAALAHGFSEPVYDAQRVFRAAMNALARPATVQPLRVDLAPPPPLTAELAALVLALADHETPIWLDPALRSSSDVAAFLRFQTGVAVVDSRQEADFALISDPSELSLHGFSRGTPEYPDRSATLLVAVEALHPGGDMICVGPGVEETARLAVSTLPDGFRQEWAANNALFPCGLDCILAAPCALAGLPRTTRILGEG